MQSEVEANVLLIKPLYDGRDARAKEIVDEGVIFYPFKYAQCIVRHLNAYPDSFLSCKHRKYEQNPTIQNLIAGFGCLKPVTNE